MKHVACPSPDYPCLDCEASANQHDVPQCFDLPSWREGFARGYEEGRLDGAYLATEALRAELVEHLRQVAYDVRLGLRHDLATPLAVVAALAAEVRTLLQGEAA
jgi:hypothetical protein